MCKVLDKDKEWIGANSYPHHPLFLFSSHIIALLEAGVLDLYGLCSQKDVWGKRCT
jgi:hypothetical protein